MRMVHDFLTPLTVNLHIARIPRREGKRMRQEADMDILVLGQDLDEDVDITDVVIQKPLITARKYIHDVYTDADGYHSGAQKVLGRPDMDLWEFIDLVSVKTGDRLRALRAHRDRGAFVTMEGAVRYLAGLNQDVPAFWLWEWQESLKRFLSRHPSDYDKPFEADWELPKIEMPSTVRAELDFKGLLPYLFIGAIILDAYGETKGAIKRRYTKK